jgi:hypothetical protein
MSASQQELCSMELVKVIRLNRISTEKHIEGKGRIQHAHKFVVPETREYTFGIYRQRKRDLREIRCESVDWFHLSTERTRLQAPVNKEIKASCFKMAWNFSTGNRSSISLSNLLYFMTLIY